MFFSSDDANITKKTALHKIRYKRFGGVKMSFCNTLKPDRTPGPIPEIRYIICASAPAYK